VYFYAFLEEKERVVTLDRHLLSIPFLVVSFFVLGAYNNIFPMSASGPAWSSLLFATILPEFFASERW